MSGLVGFNYPDPGVTSGVGAERVAALKATVSEDGAAAEFAVAFTNTRPFRVLVPFAEMPAILNEFRVAAGLMVNRQAEGPDLGHRQMLELASFAMRPFYIDGMIERLSGDRIYIMHFAESAPVAIRVTCEMAQKLRDKMACLARLAAN